MEHAASTFTVITDKMVGIAGILYILAMVLYTFYLILKIPIQDLQQQLRV